MGTACRRGWLTRAPPPRRLDERGAEEEEEEEEPDVESAALCGEGGLFCECCAPFNPETNFYGKGERFEGINLGSITVQE